jgi:hypothetical protein
LFKNHIKIDKRYDNRLLNFDDLAHQFLSKGIFNLTFPRLALYHDSGELKNNINLITDNSYSRSNNSHDIFNDRWGWNWGYRNKLLRQQFNSATSWWNDKRKIYEDSIQLKLFNMSIDEGPKRIEDFE